MSDTVLESMDRKELTTLVLLDFSKAFDSVDHPLLLTKLRALGVSGGTVECMVQELSVGEKSGRAYWLQAI